MKRLGVFINNFVTPSGTHDGEVHPKELQKLLKRLKEPKRKHSSAA